MKQIFLIIAVLFLKTLCVKADSLVAANQVDLFFPLKNEFEWEKVEKQNSELKAKFIENHPNEFFFYQDYPSYPNLENYLHIIDFNGDGLDDVIFYGKGSWEPDEGEEPNEIKIFINTRDSFVDIFRGHHRIYKIVFENEKLHKLYIKILPCCLQYIEINQIFTVDYSSELPKVNLTTQMQNIVIEDDILKHDSDYFDKPIKFKVLNGKCNIRYSPIIDDTTEVYYDGITKFSNSLGKIKAGSIGYALAEKIDEIGGIWWYVALAPNSEVNESMYYNWSWCSNSYKLGWISSKFVKEIE